MWEDIKSIHKTNEHTANILYKMMETKEFRNKNHAFLVLRATMKALRDRIGVGEAFHLGNQLPALLRGYYFEDFDLSNLTAPRKNSRGVDEFLGDVKDYLRGHDELNLEKLVPIAMNTLLEAIDEGEARQVLEQLPKDIRELKTFIS